MAKSTVRNDLRKKDPCKKGGQEMPKVQMLQTIGECAAGSIWSVCKDDGGPTIIVKKDEKSPTITIPRHGPDMATMTRGIAGLNTGEQVGLKLGSGGPTFKVYRLDAPTALLEVPRDAVRRLPQTNNFKYISS